MTFPLPQVKMKLSVDIFSMCILYVQIHRIILWVRLSNVPTAWGTLLLVPFSSLPTASTILSLTSCTHTLSLDILGSSVTWCPIPQYCLKTSVQGYNPCTSTVCSETDSRAVSPWLLTSSVSSHWWHWPSFFMGLGGLGIFRRSLRPTHGGLL